jgi:hypothetical protein
LDSQISGLLKLELPDMPRILSLENLRTSQVQSKYFDGKHEICNMVAKILEKICE